MTTTKDLRLIDQLPSGRWRVRKDGKNEGTFRELGDAVAARDVLVATLSTFMERWQMLRRRQIKDWKNEESMFRCHVAPHALARRPLSDITFEHVKLFLDDLACKEKSGGKSGLLSGKTIKNVLALLKRAFESARKRGHRVDNPCAGQDLPVPVSNDNWDWFNMEEQEALLTCDAPRHLQLLVAFAIGTGLRQGEQMALKREDVVVDGSDPHVMVMRGARDGRLPKSGKVRRVPLFGLALQAARAWSGVGVWFFDLAPRWFTARHRGEAKGTLGILMKAAGIPERPHLHWHSLRHSCASSLVGGLWSDDVRDAWSLNDVKEMLGHSSITVTERYAHLSPSSLRLKGERTSAKRLTRGLLVRVAPELKKVG